MGMCVLTRNKGAEREMDAGSTWGTDFQVSLRALCQKNGISEEGHNRRNKSYGEKQLKGKARQ